MVKGLEEKDNPFGCSECAWKGEQFEGTSPCEICIRNPKIVSKRWEGPKEVTIKGVKLRVPRDMYISKEMLEFFKTLLSYEAKQAELLRVLLERTQKQYPYQNPYDSTWWQYPTWTVTYSDNSTGSSTWITWEPTKKKWIKK